MAIASFGNGYVLSAGDTLSKTALGILGGGQFRARVNQMTVVGDGTGGTAAITVGGTTPAKVFTVTIASPGVFTCTAHGLQIGSTVRFTTTGALPTGLTAGVTYYVIATAFDANTFEVAATPAGTAINTSGTQSGAHSLTGSVLIWRKAIAANVSEVITSGTDQELDDVHLTTTSTGLTLVVYLSV